MAVDETKILHRYKKRLENELAPGAFGFQEDVTYSQAYQQFKKEQATGVHTIFERLCAFSEKTLKIKIKQSDIDKIKIPLELGHIAATPEGVYSFSALTAIIVILTVTPIGFFTGSFILMIVGLIAGLMAFLYIPQIPKYIFNTWRAKASDQIVLAVLYMIIYMEHTPNLERAVWFTAKHLPPPLSLDFTKVLWDIETKKYAHIAQSLEAYAETWRDWDEQFIESIHLIESSLYEGSKDERLKTLEKAEEVILEGTQDNMMTYAHNLQSPVRTLHMLGIVLPIMGLVMLPMVTAFMGASIKFHHLVILYNIILPFVVYSIAKSVLQVRPAGANLTDVFIDLQKKYERPAINILGLKITTPPKIIAALIFLAFAIPSLLYFIFLLRLPPEAYQAEAFSIVAIFFSFLLTAGAGVSMAAYLKLKVSYLVKIKRKITKIEEQFASAIFQLGTRIARGMPTEAAFGSVAESMPKAEVTDLFRTIDYNLKEGMSLEEAIFDPKQGAVSFFPSAIIKSVMHTLIESARKSPETAARSLIAISRYLQEVHRVNERLKDLLADTISALSTQIKLFAPTIAGIVVGLGALTTSILIALGRRLQTFEAGVGGTAQTAGFGTGLLGVFQIEHALPPYFFQVVVGFYLVEIAFIMSYLLSGIIHGPDEIEAQHLESSNILLATLAYIGIAAISVLLFSSLVGSVVAQI